MPQLRILTWHVHGSYLYYLSHVPHVFFLPVDENRTDGYAGRTRGYPWPKNVVEIPVGDLPSTEFDCILFQSERQFTTDQHRILTDSQRGLPRIYLEHDPPRAHPTDTKHPVQTADVTVVHVTAFNRLMWDCGAAPTRVVEHGVVVPRDVTGNGSLPGGITVINNLTLRGRRLGADIFARMAGQIPLDLVGMDSLSAGGLGEVSHQSLPYFVSNYRFFFNPIRYTSLGLAVCEAMAVGLPIVGLATTEMVTLFANGDAGYLETEPDRLIPHMERLIREPALAGQLGGEARRIAAERFCIHRFVRDWMDVFHEVTESRHPTTLSHHPFYPASLS